MAIPPNNNDLQRERNKFLINSLSFKNIIKRGSIANSSRDNVLPGSTPSIPVSPTITPSNTLTPSPTITNTPTITPTITVTPTVSITTTPTLSLTPTQTLTPTITITPSITPTITPTSAPLATIVENKDFLLLGLDNLILIGVGDYEPLDYVDLMLFNRLYNTKQLNFLENNRTITKLERYNFINNNISTLTKPIFYVLSGSDLSSSSQTWKLTLSCNNLEVGFIQAPEQYGNTFYLPLCSYFPYDYVDSTQINYVTGSYFTDVFKRPSYATSTALMVRGLTGSYYFSASGSVNGTVLYRRLSSITESSLFTPSQENIVAYYSELVYSNVISPPRWVFITYTIDDTYQIAFSSSSPSNIIPISGFKVDPEYTLQQHLSVVEPGLTLIDIQNTSFQTTPTPTMTPTVTPTITPTITLTPSNTPTISITPSITPFSTPTISITPSITPTITITPTVHPLSSIPTWSTDFIFIDDSPIYTWIGTYSKVENNDLGDWRPSGGDNKLIFNYYLNPDKWALYGDNDYQGPVNSSLNQTVNFIPMQGWPDSIRISIV
jgi:hypothetical protein